jgi:hypothetical protein
VAKALPQHPDLQPIAFLLGTWRGEGVAQYPTTDTFAYGEELTFEQVGEPYLLYSQRSWLTEDGSPVHFERGFLRSLGEGKVDLVLAHPIGVAEVAEGAVSGGVLELASITVVRTSTGDPVRELTRRYELRGDELVYEGRMATDEVPLTIHTRASLKRA